MAGSDASGEVQAIERMESRATKWWRLQIAWWITHYLAGCAGIALTALAGTIDGWLLPVAASIMTGLVTFLGALPRAATYRKAYYVYDRARVGHLAGQLDLAGLVAAYGRAGDIVLSAETPDATAAGGETKPPPPGQ